jgi:hypothetical protein
MRGGLLLLLATICLQVSCSNEPRTLACADTVANACAAAGSCALTWADAQTDTTFCPGATDSSPARVDCGAYHVVTVKVGADNRTYYYEAAPDAANTGALIAIVTAHSASATTTCDAGPTDGFKLPVCSGMGSVPLSQCFDGGVDAAAP